MRIELTPRLWQSRAQTTTQYPLKDSHVFLFNCKRSIGAHGRNRTDNPSAYEAAALPVVLRGRVYQTLLISFLFICRAAFLKSFALPWTLKYTQQGQSLDVPRILRGQAVRLSIPYARMSLRRHRPQKLQRAGRLFSSTGPTFGSYWSFGP